MDTCEAEKAMLEKMNPPMWPKIKDDGLTPLGYGRKNGGKPAFCTTSPEKHLLVYLPHSFTGDKNLARSILEQSMSKIDSYFPELILGCIAVKDDDGKELKLRMEVAFWHVLLHHVM